MSVVSYYSQVGAESHILVSRHKLQDHGVQVGNSTFFILLEPILDVKSDAWLNCALLTSIKKIIQI